jgi:hypothetical protein
VDALFRKRRAGGSSTSIKVEKSTLVPLIPPVLVVVVGNAEKYAFQVIVVVLVITSRRWHESVAMSWRSLTMSKRAMQPPWSCVSEEEAMALPNL